MVIHCPHCQSEQNVRPDGISLFCGKCHLSIQVQEMLHPSSPSQAKTTQTKLVSCFRCHIEIPAPLKAQSFLCKKCGYRNDLQDYHVKSVLSRDLETYGNLSIDAAGTVLNSTAKVKEALIAGKFIGHLTADSITLKSGAIFEGGMMAECLTLESSVQCSIKKEFWVKKIILTGLYQGNIQTHETVFLKKNAIFIGTLSTKNLFMEEGATLMGEIKIGM